MVYDPVYKIVTGGAGSFLCPPGHPHHTHHLEGKDSPRHRTITFSGALDHALTDEFDGPDYIKDRVRKMMDDATLVESEMWVRQVYGYFRTAYAPENGSRNVSEAIYHDPARIAVNEVRGHLVARYAEPEYVSTLPLEENNYRDGSAKPLRGARRGFEVTAARDGSTVYVYALADDGSRYGSLDILEAHREVLEEAGYTDAVVQPVQRTGSEFIPERVKATNPSPAAPIDPARHLAVLTIRAYFPGHTPRLDLIEDPGTGYGTWPCTKCGEKVQYEAEFDKLAKVSTRIDGRGMTHWSHGTACPEGGDHTR